MATAARSGTERVLESYLTQLLLPNEIGVSKSLVPLGVATEPMPARRAASPALAAKPPAAQPEWAFREFRVVLFKVAHLLCATPTHELGRIVELADVTPMPRQPRWCGGITRVQGQAIAVLRTSMILGMEAPGEAGRSVGKLALVARRGRYALEIDGAVGTESLQPAQVRWRMRREQRPWLMGLVMHRLCALIDLSRIPPWTGRNP